MYKIKLRTGTKSYPVYVGRGLLGKIGPLLSRHLPGCTVMVVSDKNVAFHYAERFLQCLRQGGFRPCLEVLEGGEKEKSLARASELYMRALKAGMDRDSAIIALGGGIPGDLAGFVAATYLRGVPFVQVPTTLLAMVDSSVGGKVGVNHPLGKNLIGAFYQPALVLTDINTLHTLPPREFNAGLAELVKYGIIWDEKLFERLESFCPAGSPENGIVEIEGSSLLKLIIRAVLIKGKIICQDEKEENLRRVLNLGHTFGHALESATGFEYYLHGEAVACGMAMAARLAVLLKKLDRVAAGRIRAFLRHLKPPPPPREVSPKDVLEALYYDKKKKGEKLLFVLPAGLGRAAFCQAPPLSLIESVIDEYLEGKLI
jgi:3-dehydroquinate synthase